MKKCRWPRELVSAPFEIVGLLGAGGMGEVYRARDLRLERLVALKILSESVSSPHALDRAGISGGSAVRLDGAAT